MAKRADTSPSKAAPFAGQAIPPRAPAVGPELESPSTEIGPRVKGQLPSPSMPTAPTQDDLLAVFGDNLKVARFQSGLKQSDIAEQTSMTQQHPSLIEAGRQNLTLKTMMKLAQVVDCDVSVMLQRHQTGRTKKERCSI